VRFTPDDAWSALAGLLRSDRGKRVTARARAPERLLELYDIEACPFCRKVRETMSELDLEYVCRPAARGSNNREATPTYARGRKSYPHLVDPNTGVSMAESEDIIDYLHRTYASPRASRRPFDTARSMAISIVRPKGRFARAAHRRREQPKELLVLYQYENCGFSRQVRERLAALNLDHHVKSCAKGSARRAELERLGGKVRVPYLVDPNTGRAMYESKAILRYLEEQYG
jgi:glutathione S-transferase